MLIGLVLLSRLLPGLQEASCSALLAAVQVRKQAGVVDCYRRHRLDRHLGGSRFLYRVSQVLPWCYKNGNLTVTHPATGQQGMTVNAAIQALEMHLVGIPKALHRASEARAPS